MHSHELVATAITICTVHDTEPCGIYVCDELGRDGCFLVSLCTLTAGLQQWGAAMHFVTCPELLFLYDTLSAEFLAWPVDDQQWSFELILLYTEKRIALLSIASMV